MHIHNYEYEDCAMAIAVHNCFKGCHLRWRPLLRDTYVKLVWESLPWAWQKGPDHFEVGCDWADPFQGPVCWNQRKHKPPTLYGRVWVKAVLFAGYEKYLQHAGSTIHHNTLGVHDSHRYT